MRAWNGVKKRFVTVASQASLLTSTKVFDIGTKGDASVLGGRGQQVKTGRNPSGMHIIFEIVDETQLFHVHTSMALNRITLLLSLLFLQDL